MNQHDVVVFEVGRRRCAVAVSSVREVFPPGPITPVPTAPGVVRGLVLLRGQVMTLVDLGGWIDPGDAPELTGPRPVDHALAIEATLREGPVRAALAVDRVVRLSSVPLSTAAAPPRSPAFVIGSLVDADGSALLLDVELMLQAVRQAAVDAEAKA